MPDPVSRGVPEVGNDDDPLTMARDTLRWVEFEAPDLPTARKVARRTADYVDALAASAGSGEEPTTSERLPTKALDAWMAAHPMSDARRFVEFALAEGSGSQEDERRKVQRAERKAQRLAGSGHQLSPRMAAWLLGYIRDVKRPPDGLRDALEALASQATGATE